MRSEEFFNILDDMDDRIVSEIYEDVQRPQKLTVVPRSPKRLPRLLLGSAACAAVIAAAAVTVRFAVPGTLLTDVSELSPASGTVSANDSNSDTSESSFDWFAQKHIKPWRRTDILDADIMTDELSREQEFCITDDVDWTPEDYEIIASDNGTVMFAGKISDAYGSVVIIKHAENAYVAYGCLDPDTVTVSTGDTVTTGEALAHPKPFSCLFAGAVVNIKTSRLPITEEFFQSKCDLNCQGMREVKNQINFNEHGMPDSDGNHHIIENAGDKVSAVERGVVVYTGTDSDNNGMVVTLTETARTFIVYKGLDTTFPDYYVEDDLMKAVEGDTIGYVGDSGDAYWFVLDLLEFEEFAEENGINFYPTHISFTNTIVHKP